MKRVRTLLSLAPLPAARLALTSLLAAATEGLGIVLLVPLLGRLDASGPGLPQFLATPARLDARLRSHTRWLLRPVEAGTDYTVTSRQLEFHGWSAPEQVAGRMVRQSADRVAALRFLVNEDTLRDADRLMLTVGLEAEHSTNGELWFNGRQVAHLAFREPGRVYYVVGIPRRQVRTLEYDVLESNVLEWRGPDGRSADTVMLWGFRVHAAGR